MWMQTINTLIFVIGTVSGVYTAIHLANIQRQKMPDHITSKLDRFSRMAVQKIEQQNKTMHGPSKKQLAINIVMKLFRIYHLPIPPQEALDIAIESAVFSLPHKES